jgi:CRP/FNR family transcriptional regulator
MVRLESATADAAMARAIADSRLRPLPPQLLDELLTGSSLATVSAGAVIHHEGDPTAHFELVVSGLAKIFVTAPEGKTATVRYCRSGSLIGVVSLFSDDFSMPATVLALTDMELLQFSPAMVRQATARDSRVAVALIRELSDRVLHFIAEIPGAAFTSVRQRVARHLLDLAGPDVPSNRLAPSPYEAGNHEAANRQFAVTTSQRELAEAVGSAREVVVRILRELRESGTVRTERDRIVILEPERLIELSKWNPGH